MPHCIYDIGVPTSKETLEIYYEKLKNGSEIDKNNPEECKKLHDALEYLWGVQ